MFAKSCTFAFALQWITLGAVGAPCNSWGAQGGTNPPCRTKAPCPTASTKVAPSCDDSWDLWAWLQPVMLFLYILVAILFALILLSCVCRACSRAFVTCGCDTWFRPCFFGAAASSECESDTTFLTGDDSDPLCPCQGKMPKCKQLEAKRNSE